VLLCTALEYSHASRRWPWPLHPALSIPSSGRPATGVIELSPSLSRLLSFCGVLILSASSSDVSIYKPSVVLVRFLEPFMG